MIGIIDYGSGNVKSLINVIKDFGMDYVLINKIELLQNCDKLLLPGVGEASFAMRKLAEYNLINFIKNTIVPILGICLGLQLFTEYSEEGNIECLGIIEDKTIKFNKKNLIIPHMGWNDITIATENHLVKGIDNGTDFYFANSFYYPVNKYTVATTNYGVDFSAIINKDNYWGIQFHPEKSGVQGIKIMENFLKL